MKPYPMAWGPLAEGKNGFFQNETLIIGHHEDPEIVKWFMTLLPPR